MLVGAETVISLAQAERAVAAGVRCDIIYARVNLIYRYNFFMHICISIYVYIHGYIYTYIYIYIYITFLCVLDIYMSDALLLASGSLCRRAPPPPSSAD